MTTSLIKVFVYGTLKRGEPNHHWLSQSNNGFSRFLGSGRTVEKFPLVVGTRYNIPFLLNKPGVGHQIHGEIYEVDSKMFQNLDILEDYPNYYNREIKDISSNQDIVQCWLYIISSFPEALLEKKHLESYHNSTEQPYCERSQRFSHIEASKDMGF